MVSRKARYIQSFVGACPFVWKQFAPRTFVDIQICATREVHLTDSVHLPIPSIDFRTSLSSVWHFKLEQQRRKIRIHKQTSETNEIINNITTDSVFVLCDRVITPLPTDPFNATRWTIHLKTVCGFETVFVHHDRDFLWLSKMIVFMMSKSIWVTSVQVFLLHLLQNQHKNEWIFRLWNWCRVLWTSSRNINNDDDDKKPFEGSEWQFPSEPNSELDH